MSVSPGASGSMRHIADGTENKGAYIDRFARLGAFSPTSYPDLFRVSLSTAAAGRPHGYPEQVRV